MTNKLKEEILLVGQYAGIENLTVYKDKEGILGVYEAVDDEAGIDFDEGINWYRPNSDWNALQSVCKKIIESYHDNREYIFKGQNDVDIDMTFNAVVNFIKFWNDENEEKIIWNNTPDWVLEHFKNHKKR